MCTSFHFGKQRGLAQCASTTGVFCILALDHRQAVLNAFSRYGEKAFQESVNFKKQVIQSLSSFSTAFLLDPVIGAAPAISARVLPGAIGLIVTIEESGYAGPSFARVSRLPTNWNAEKIKKMGASAIKLLVYYHPEAETAFAMQGFLEQVSQDCTRCDIPLFLEILTYSPSKEGLALSNEQRRDAIIRSAAELTPIGGDVLKVEFPAGSSENRRIWEDACCSISQASQIPWVLLSAGVDSEVFLEQAKTACDSGASGILAGRAIWKEALSLDGEARNAFLQDIAQERLRQLLMLCEINAKPYYVLSTPQTVEENWQIRYLGF